MAAAWVPLAYHSEPASAPPARSNVPRPKVALVPCISRGDFVITLITPKTAFAPHTAEAGPRMTSICLISLRFTGRKSHITNPKKS
jgi:hypothetical protein